jgi:hypothetical protein
VKVNQLYVKKIDANDNDELNRLLKEFEAFHAAVE